MIVFQPENEFPFDEYKVFNLEKEELDRIAGHIVESYFSSLKSIFLSIRQDLQFLLLLKELLILIDYSQKDLIHDSNSYLLKLGSFLKNTYLLEKYDEVCSDLFEGDSIYINSLLNMDVNHIGQLKKSVLNFGLEKTARYLVHNEIQRTIHNIENYENSSYVIVEYFGFYDFIVNLVISLIKRVLLNSKKSLLNTEAAYYLSFLNESYLVEHTLQIKIHRYGFQEVSINPEYTKIEDIYNYLKNPKSIEYTLVFYYPFLEKEDRITNSFYDKIFSVVVKGLPSEVFKIYSQTDLMNYVDLFYQSDKIDFIF